ncbi:MAG TPA: mucoidy inhibitor MuiA family protein, partial [Burkholderiales bacterium]|nr:mucoidy inhibitor MuiA family protein [Burkholderiales bacterium]
MNPNKSLPRRILPAAVGAAVLCLSCGTARAEDASRIIAVTLYPGSATIERTARVEPGMALLRISGLPANFDPQSVRVDADPGVAIGEVSTQDAARAQARNPREAQLEERIQALKDRQSELDGETKSAQMVTEFLSRLGAPGEKPAPIPDARSLVTVVDLIRKGSGESIARAQRAQIQKRGIGRQLAALERDLARLKSGVKDTRSILVGVSSERGGSARVSYQVNGAGWRPAYRASLDSRAARVELVRQGVIQQTTGEDWSGVKLKLSTGQPRLSPQGPDPRPWWVSLPVAHPYSNVSGAVAEAPAALAMRLESKMADKLAQAQAPVETQTTFSTEFEVPGLVTLPADGRKVTVSLARLTLPAKMRLRVVPRLDPAAIVTAEAARPEGVWLPGEIQLARDGNVVGSTQWNPQSS